MSYILRHRHVEDKKGNRQTVFLTMDKYRVFGISIWEDGVELVLKRFPSKEEAERVFKDYIP